jgi:Tol biopolymer transport system component
MQRPAQPRPPEPGRDVPLLALAAGGLVVVLVVVALLVLGGRSQPALEASLPPSSPAPSVAIAEPTVGGPAAPGSSVGPGSSVAAVPGSAAPAPDRPIAYSRTSGATTIWSMQPSAAAIQLDQDGASTGAAWSRDARQIAFIRRTGSGPGEIWVMAADGSSAHALTIGAQAVEHPSWSPNGDRIAFAASYGSTDTQLWVIPSAGGKPVQVTYVTGSPGAPSWSPDGQTLIYANAINGSSGLWIADPANPTSPTIGLFGLPEGTNRTPAWSPDGSRIAFDSTLNGTDQIWVMNADGSAPNSITPASLAASWPTWSPDGKELVFQVLKGSDTDLYLMPADGSASPVDITKDPKHAVFDPAWW